MKIQMLFIMIASLALAKPVVENPTPIPDEDIVIFIDFWSYSLEKEGPLTTGSVIVSKVGTSWIRNGRKGEWERKGDLPKDQVAECRSLVADPKELKTFAAKDDGRRFKFNMDNHHVKFPEAVRNLYRNLIAPKE